MSPTCPICGGSEFRGTPNTQWCAGCGTELRATLAGQMEAFKEAWREPAQTALVAADAGEVGSVKKPPLVLEGQLSFRQIAESEDSPDDSATLMDIEPDSAHMGSRRVLIDALVGHFDFVVREFEIGGNYLTAGRYRITIEEIDE